MIVSELVDEELRQKLLKEERELRAKQPEPWTKQYRKYSNYLGPDARKKKKEVEKNG